MIFSDAPALIMTTPIAFTNYIIKNEFKGNKSGVTILNNTTLGIHRNQEMQTKFTGTHYNRQRPHVIMNQGFECWGTAVYQVSFNCLR